MKRTSPPPSANLVQKQPSTRTAAPPVYRPQAAKNVPPPVYRPTPGPHLTTKSLSTAQGRPSPVQSKPLATLPKNSQVSSRTAAVTGSRAPQGSRVVQRFPFTVKHKTESLQLIVRLEGDKIVLYRAGIEIGYLKIKLNGTVWELKDILVDNSLRGRDLGSILVYFFASLAHSNGATGLSVLLANGTGLYQRNGFTVTPNPINPHNPPTITGVPNTVRTTAQGVVTANYEVTRGLPQPARQPPAAAAPQLINNNTYGNPQIRNEDL